MKTTRMLTLVMTMFIMGTTTMMGQTRHMNRPETHREQRMMHTDAPRHHQPTVYAHHHSAPMHCPPPPPVHHRHRTMHHQHYHSAPAEVVAGTLAGATLGLIIGSMAY